MDYEAVMHCRRVGIDAEFVLFRGIGCKVKASWSPSRYESLL